MYHEVTIQAASGGFGQYEANLCDVGDGWADETDLAHEMADGCDEMIEIEDDAELPDGVEDIRGRIRNAPDRVFACRTGEDWTYHGTTNRDGREQTLSDLNPACDPIVDDSRADLAAVWAAVGTPIYRVLDDEAVNVAGAQIRRLTNAYWLYVDDTDGYSVVTEDEIAGWYCVADSAHTPLGYAPDGCVFVI